MGDLIVDIDLNLFDPAMRDRPRQARGVEPAPASDDGGDSVVAHAVPGERRRLTAGSLVSMPAASTAFVPVAVSSYNRRRGRPSGGSCSHCELNSPISSSRPSALFGDGIGEEHAERPASDSPGRWGVPSQVLTGGFARGVLLRCWYRPCRRTRSRGHRWWRWRSGTRRWARCRLVRRRSRVRGSAGRCGR